VPCGGGSVAQERGVLDGPTDALTYCMKAQFTTRDGACNVATCPAATAASLPFVGFGTLVLQQPAAAFDGSVAQLSSHPAVALRLSLRSNLSQALQGAVTAQLQSGSPVLSTNAAAWLRALSPADFLLGAVSDGSSAAGVSPAASIAWRALLPLSGQAFGGQQVQPALTSFLNSTDGKSVSAEVGSLLAAALDRLCNASTALTDMHLACPAGIPSVVSDPATQLATQPILLIGPAGPGAGNSAASDSSLGALNPSQTGIVAGAVLGGVVLGVIVAAIFFAATSRQRGEKRRAARVASSYGLTSSDKDAMMSPRGSPDGFMVAAETARAGTDYSGEAAVPLHAAPTFRLDGDAATDAAAAGTAAAAAGAFAIPLGAGRDNDSEDEDQDDAAAAPITADSTHDDLNFNPLSATPAAAAAPSSSAERTMTSAGQRSQVAPLPEDATAAPLEAAEAHDATAKSPVLASATPAPAPQPASRASARPASSLAPIAETPGGPDLRRASALAPLPARGGRASVLAAAGGASLSSSPSFRRQDRGSRLTTPPASGLLVTAAPVAAAGVESGNAHHSAATATTEAAAAAALPGLAEVDGAAAMPGTVASGALAAALADLNPMAAAGSSSTDGEDPAADTDAADAAAAAAVAAMGLGGAGAGGVGSRGGARSFRVASRVPSRALTKADSMRKPHSAGGKGV
jgi:hypothetical protein